jgi:hypothetical protein
MALACLNAVIFSAPNRTQFGSFRATRRESGWCTHFVVLPPEERNDLAPRLILTAVSE